MDQDLVVKTYSPAKSLGDARRRAALMLLMATGVALVPCTLIFVAVLYGEWMTGAFRTIVNFMFDKPVWAVLAATSPLAGALLVGYGYMQRAIRRRGQEKHEALEQATGRAGGAEPAPAAAGAGAKKS
jgi:hypothetical protein